MTLISALPIFLLFTPLGFISSLILCNVLAFDFRNKLDISLNNKLYYTRDLKIICYLFIFVILLSAVWQNLGRSYIVTTAFLVASSCTGVVSVINGYKAFKAISKGYTGRYYIYSCFALIFVFLLSLGIFEVFFIFAYALLK